MKAKWIRRVLLLVAGTATLSLGQSATETFRLTGIVLTTHQCTAVTARLYYPKANIPAQQGPVVRVKISAVSDDGQFQFDGLTEGPYLLEIYVGDNLLYQKAIRVPTPKPLEITLDSQQSTGFTLACRLPFDYIATKPDPVSHCGNCGVISAQDKATCSNFLAKAYQSEAKNNFCGDLARMKNITFDDLRKMQLLSSEKGWVMIDLSSRKMLQSFFSLNGELIGEGDVVRLKAWVKEAHISDCVGGEQVNCRSGGFDNNDIHMALVDPSSGGRDQDPCSSVTAEVSPHFRPIAWSMLDMKTPVKNVVRVTGQLFFDNSHIPCAGLSKSVRDKQPYRSSNWEIHPVYRLEVCKDPDPTRCSVNSNDTSLWIDYDRWLAERESVVEVTGSRRGCVPSGSSAAGQVIAVCPTKGSTQ